MDVEMVGVEGVVHAGDTEEIALGVDLAVEGGALAELMVVAEECGGGSEVPSRLVPLGVEGCGVVAEGTFVGEFRGSAMETRGVDTADGVVGLHGGIERAVGVEGGDAPFAAEIYGGCSSAQETTLVG